MFFLDIAGPSHTKNQAAVSSSQLPVSSSSSALFTAKTEPQETFPIELLPTEIMYLILERMDAQTLLNCMYVSAKWKQIALNIANTDKNRWKSIVECSSLNYGDSLSRKSKDLDWRELFKNACSWNNVNTAVFELKSTVEINDVVKIGIYKDNIIVLNHEGVKYYDVKTHAIIKQFEIQQCIEFIETDQIILAETMQTNMAKVFLFGKNKPDDCFSLVLELRQAQPRTIELTGLLYCVEKNSCYIFDENNVLKQYYYNYDNLAWDKRTLGRYYGSPDLPLSMITFNGEVYVLLKSGQMITCLNESRKFKKVMKIEMSRSYYAKMVHFFCVVSKELDHHDNPIIRYLDNDKVFYNFVCLNFTCLTQHGEMLILGYDDGKVEFFMPRARDRKDMLKRRIHIQEIDNVPRGPEDLLIVSIDVFEAFEKHHLFVATRARLYRLEITHLDSEEMWNNLPEILPLPKMPRLT